jgi:hypothetical protein
MDAAALERSGEQRWRELVAATSDDDDVRSLFEASAASATSNGQRVRRRLLELGFAVESTGSHEPNDILQAAPQIEQNARGVEERLLHNLIFAAADKAGQCALYKSLGAVAALTGDTATGVLVREIEENEQRILERVGHLLPSRAKIAFNMLTISEVDPAVDTKAKDDRPES